MSEAWSQWQGQVIDGKFQLRQYLGGSGQSAVFLAHFHSSAPRANDARGNEASPVAIRLIADSSNAELQLSRWRMAQSLSHPHLIKILDTGRCRLGEIDLIFVVMEYADETLAQIVPERPLTVDEACEMLTPTLDALTYLHERGLVHSRLKPANIMAIDEDLKLACEKVCPADEPMSGPAGLDVFAAKQSGSPATLEIYDAPETASGVRSPAGDVWSLGVTLAEVLTQRLPVQDDANGEDADPLLPDNLPRQFMEIVRGCVRRDLKLRWTIPAIKSRLEAARGEQRAAAEGGPVLEQSLHQATVQPEVSNANLVLGLPTSEHQVAPVSEPVVTFAEALRRKPVASERPAITPEAIARAAAAGVAPGPHSTQSASSDRAGYFIPVALRSRSAALEKAVGSPISTETTEVQPLSKEALRKDAAPDRISMQKERLLNFASLQKARALSVLLAKQTSLKLYVSQIAMNFRRTTSQAGAAGQRRGSQVQRALGDLASKIAARLGPYPGQTIFRFAIAGFVLIAAVAAVFSGIKMLRHRSTHSARHETNISPASVKVVKQERKATAKKRASTAPAKPRPGIPLSAPQQASTQAAAQPSAQPPAQQPSVQAASAQTNAQLASQHADPHAAPQMGVNAQSSVRRIDDGGAEDDLPRQENGVRNSGNHNNYNRSESTNFNAAQEVMPEVSESALHTIHGTVRVSVRVRVDRSGNVARVELASAGPSRYFARKSLEAAQNWKFAPGQSSPFLVHFEFRNNGARAFATKVGS